MFRILLIVIVVALGTYALINGNIIKLSKPAQIDLIPQQEPSPSQAPTLPPIPTKKVLPTSYHIFQTFNNCGPAALSMALSHYGVNVTQYELGQALRPYQIAGGDNDDKSVTLEELAQKAKEYNLVPYHRPNGDIEKLKQFIANGMPVITRTWTKANEDIGHYRIVKGYDENAKTLIQDDSLQNKNLTYTYGDFNAIWNKFNYEYLVLVPQDKVQIAELILTEEKDAALAWQNAVKNSKARLQSNPNDITERFNLSVALYNTGQIKESIDEFEKVEGQLPFRSLWYQIEPIQAYFDAENYQKVLSLTDKILKGHNRAFSELYIIRGNVYQKQHNINAARNEYQKAITYNRNLIAAKEALQNVN